MPEATWVLLLTMSFPLWPQYDHLLMGPSSGLIQWYPNFKSYLTVFFNMTICFSSLYSNAILSHQISVQMCSQEICCNCVTLLCQCGTTFLRNVSRAVLKVIKAVLKATACCHLARCSHYTHITYLLLIHSPYQWVYKCIDFFHR